MQCLVDRSNVYDLYCREIKTKILAARNSRKCGECGKEINPGEKYEHYTGCQDGSFFHASTCLLCVELRNQFCCVYYFGSVLEDIKEAFSDKEDISLGCMDGLSPQALDWVEKTLEETYA